MYIDDNALETCEDEVLSCLPNTIRYISAQSNRPMVGPWLFRLGTLTNLEVVDISYQYRSRIPDVTWPQELYFGKKRQIRTAPGGCTDLSIRITCPCNVYPLTPHFYIVKLGFIEVYIIFLFLL